MKRRPWLALVAVLALLASGCTDSSPQPDPTTSAPTGTTKAWDAALADLDLPCQATEVADLTVHVCQSARDAASNQLPAMTAYVLSSGRGMEAFTLLATPSYDPASAEGKAKLAAYEPWRRQVWTVLGEALIPEQDRLGLTEMTGMRKTSFGLFGRNPFLSWVITDSQVPGDDRGVWFAARADAAQLGDRDVLNPDPEVLRSFLVGTGAVADECRLPMYCSVKLSDGLKASIGYGGETGWTRPLSFYQQPEPDLTKPGTPAFAVAAQTLVHGFLPADAAPGLATAAGQLQVNPHGRDRVMVNGIELSASPGLVEFTNLSEYLAPRLLPNQAEWALAEQFVKAYTNADLSRTDWNESLAKLLIPDSVTPPGELQRFTGQASPIAVTQVEIIDGEPVWTISFSIGGDQLVSAQVTNDRLLSITEA